MGKPSQISADKAHFTPEQLAKARRAVVILYIVMFVFIAAPFVVWWLAKR